MKEIPSVRLGFPDNRNSDHVREHGVPPIEAEEAHLDPSQLGAPAYKVGGEQRSGWIGSTNAGRVLFSSQFAGAEEFAS
jgi:hypothetical protein